jgi:hypothetical protein
MPDPLTTAQKALEVNLDRSRYGTIAEIGAGQEVARWFFHVGGAAGTVAKSISAYDMTVSDGIYGTSPRYVSRERVRQMLDHEYAVLLESLAPARGDTTAFFAFADTVATRSYTRKEDGAGWLGSRFQDRPGAAPSQILLHVRLLDPEATLQQEALGLLGVNLVYATSFLHGDVEAFVASLGDHLDRDRLEVDFVDVGGPVFARADARSLTVGLLRRRLARSVMFGADGRAAEPSAVLYKRALYVLPGEFRPVLRADLDVLAAAVEQIRAGEGQRAVSLALIMTPEAEAAATADAADLLARVDTLAAAGLPTLVTDIADWWRLVRFFERFTREQTVFVAGADAFTEAFRERRFEELGGGVFEALGRLFKRWVRVAIHPSCDRRSDAPFALESLPVGPEYRYLLQHLLQAGLLRALEVPPAPGFRDATEVLVDLRRGDGSWENAVPEAAASVIKAQRLFGYPGERARQGPAGRA